MSFMNLLKIAYTAMMKNKMRSILTMLGIIIGVGAVIVMVSIGQGTQKQIQNQIGGLGVNLLTVYPGASRQGSVSMGSGTSSRLTFDDIEKLTTESTLLLGISPVVRTGIQVVGGSGNWNTMLNGVSPDFPAIRQWNLSDGEFFSDADVKSQAKVCILGATIASNLYGDQSPVGEQIRLRNIPFRVIGVLEAKGMEQDDIIVAPYTTVYNKLNRGKYISMILCSSVSADQMQNAQAEILTLMRESHKIKEGDDDDFTIRNMEDVIKTSQQVTGFLTTFLASIAGISLIVGGIGIMNIMLVSVSERTREIGIRMAIGAKEKDILRQFLVESVVLSISGGIIGIIMGVIITMVVQDVFKWTVALSIPTILLAFGFSAMVGIFFGYYPARQAAGLNPIDALRYE